MENQKIDLRLSRYFSLNTQFYGFLVGVAAIVVLIGCSVILGFLLLIIPLAIFTAVYGIEIDISKNTYKKYSKILGAKFGEDSKLEKVEYIFINGKKVSQQMNYKSVSNTVRFYEYTGYLKFSEDSNLELVTTRDKDLLIKNMKKIGDLLKVKVLDNSGREVVEVA